MCVSVCECASVSVCNWFYNLIHGMGRKTNIGIFVWKFGFWPGEVMEKSWNFFLIFLWEPWTIAPVPIDGLTQERRNPIANAMELHISCINPSQWSTIETLYNTINFCSSTHKRHSIARPKGRGLGCLLWVQRATYCVDLSKLSSIKYLL